MRGVRLAGACAVAILLTATLVAFSRGRWVVETSGDALLRLSWRAVGERVERCRDATQAELEALPVHMRQKQICDARLVPFRLVVTLDDVPVVEREVHAAGAREDRPAYVLEELHLAPGPHHLVVRFAVDRSAAEGRSDGSPLILDTDFEALPRGVTLVTRDADTGGLVIRAR